jgi:hypothetical protein
VKRNATPQLTLPLDTRATGPGGNSASYMVLFTLLVLVLAVLIQQSFGEELLRAARMTM